MNEKDTEIVKKAVKNEHLLSELLQNLLSNKDEVRYPSFNVVLVISEEYPEILYTKWNFLIDLLNSKNNYHKLIAIRLIANLTRIDTENKFEKIFEEYYNILEGNKAMTAGHLVGNSGKIAKAKPELQHKITSKLLNIDKLHRGKQKELIKAYAIDAFDEYFIEIEDKKQIIDFVKVQLKSDSPKTRKKAKEFLDKWEEK
jgi:hypothetical protein